MGRNFKIAVNHNSNLIAATSLLVDNRVPGKQMSESRALHLINFTFTCTLCLSVSEQYHLMPEFYPSDALILCVVSIRTVISFLNRCHSKASLIAIAIRLIHYSLRRVAIEYPYALCFAAFTITCTHRKTCTKNIHYCWLTFTTPLIFPLSFRGRIHEGPCPYRQISIATFSSSASRIVPVALPRRD